MKRTMTRTILAGVSAAVLLGACGSGGDSASEGASTGSESAASGGGGGGGETAITLVAKDTSFDQEKLEIPAGEAVTITFDNQDDIEHNLDIMTPSGDKTEIKKGPVTQELMLTVDEPGDYEFQCDVHAGQMTGTLTVTG